MQIEQIFENKIKTLRNNLSVNAIHNRFDIKYGDDFDLYKINDELYIPVKQIGVSLFLGLYLVMIQYEVLEIFIAYLFKKYKTAKKIELLHVRTDSFRDLERKPHWHIDLPETIEEFDSTLPRSVRYNTKRYPKKIREKIGEYDIKHYPKTEITEKLVKTYLELKRKTHNTDYHLNTPLDYIKEYYITDCYTLETKENIVAVLFLSNTDNYSYLDNITYDINLAKYSVGTVLYYAVIRDLIEKKYKKLFLLGGTQEYKRLFNGKITNTISASVSRDDGILYKILKHIAKFSSKQPKVVSNSINFLTKLFCFRTKYKRFYKNKFKLYNKEFYKLLCEGADFTIVDNFANTKISEYVNYAPSSYLITDAISWMKNNIKESPSLSFVDVGSGKGYVLYVASKYFKHIAGIELDKKLCTSAVKNMKILKVNNYEIINKNIIDVETDEYNKYDVFYLYNPFGASLISLVIDKIKESGTLKPRKILVIYANSVHSAVFEKHPEFKIIKEIRYTENFKTIIYELITKE